MDFPVIVNISEYMSVKEACFMSDVLSKDNSMLTAFINQLPREIGSTRSNGYDHLIQLLERNEAPGLV